jgi:hypothetical protein
MMAALSFLDFDFSEDADGTGTFDAMATVTPQQLPALLAEVARVLNWANQQFPSSRMPLDEGGEWDFQLQCQQEWSADQGLDYDLAAGTFSTAPGPAGAPRHHLTLSLSGRPAFCDEFKSNLLNT